MKLAAVITLLIVIFLGLGLYLRLKKPAPSPTVSPSSAPSAPVTNQSPLTIAAMQQKSYPGSNITIEQTLTPGAIYNQYIVSYQSEGLKQFALLTVPQGQKPNGGWPVIIFNHGYIPPAQYSTAESYAVMVEPLASAGYIVFKPDYRGNGSSQGKPEQPYISPSYVTDSMNALASIKKYPDADPNKIGVFGHSMGGNVTLHELVVTHDFKAAEIISGVVGNETDIDCKSRRA
ncbi:MAG: alpha/beta fold hydrolase, partial [Patescibacteria group bacterium]|nr:alpha/beta fold hydrolase [Patescibacteria group bacterium]